MVFRVAGVGEVKSDKEAEGTPVNYSIFVSLLAQTDSGTPFSGRVVDDIPLHVSSLINAI